MLNKLYLFGMIISSTFVIITGIRPNLHDMSLIKKMIENVNEMESTLGIVKPQLALFVRRQGNV